MYNYICVQPSRTHAHACTHTQRAFNFPAHVHKLWITQSTFQVRCSVLVCRLIFWRVIIATCKVSTVGVLNTTLFVGVGPLRWPSDLLPSAIPQLELLSCGGPLKMTREARSIHFTAIQQENVKFIISWELMPVCFAIYISISEDCLFEGHCFFHWFPHSLFYFHSCWPTAIVLFPLLCSYAGEENGGGEKSLTLRGFVIGCITKNSYFNRCNLTWIKIINPRETTLPGTVTSMNPNASFYRNTVLSRSQLDGPERPFDLHTEKIQEFLFLNSCGIVF